MAKRGLRCFLCSEKQWVPRQLRIKVPYQVELKGVRAAIRVQIELDGAGAGGDWEKKPKKSSVSVTRAPRETCDKVVEPYTHMQA